MRQKITEKTVYKFDELSDVAKDKAREWWRGNVQHDEWSEYIIDDAAQIAELIGIDLCVKSLKSKPAIYWSGFSSQGDGACFEGRYRYAKNNVKAVKRHAQEDETLHRIVSGLYDVQRRYQFKAALDVAHRGHYYHSRSNEITDVGERELSAGDFETMSELLRDYMDWIYRQLEREYDWYMSDEQVDDCINANEYEFDEQGRIA